MLCAGHHTHPDAHTHDLHRTDVDRRVRDRSGQVRFRLGWVAAAHISLTPGDVCTIVVDDHGRENSLELKLRYLSSSLSGK